MTYRLDGRRFESKEVAYPYLIQQLQLPAYTGHNLDALWEVLTDIPSMQIEINHGRWIYRQLGDYGLRLLDVFGDLDQENYHMICLHW